MAVHVRRKVVLSWYERSYLPEIFRGLGVTLRHLFGNLLGAKKTRHLQTIQYPEEQRVYPPRFRGQHRLLQRDDGTPRCVACYLCATACPAYCIHIVAEESPDHAIEKRPASFEIDLLRCVYCGFCVEACPEDAIRMDTGAHVPAFTTREQGMIGKTDLLNLPGRAGTVPSYGAQNYREGKPRGS
jgi:NADH-quinone oxidoreductase subunit I